MENDFTVNAAYITAIAAVIAPTITAIIHSLKEYKIAKLNNTISTRLELYEAFTNAYAKCQYGSEKTGYMSAFYNSSMRLIAICHHSSTRRSLFKLANRVLHSGASSDTDILYERCIKLLAREF